MEFENVERRSGLTPETFAKEYLIPRKPVILTDFASNWKALDKWSFDFFRNRFRGYPVGLDNASYHAAGKGYMGHAQTMPFDQFIDAIEHQEIDLRLHLFQPLKVAPELMDDIQKPTIMKGFIDTFPFMFFGGKGSKLPLHYDIDRAHVFLTHFQTTKEVYLFPYEERALIYQHPFTVQAKAPVLPPNYQEFPASAFAKGLKATLHHGETLFMPRLFWHFVYYSDSGFSLALRANDSVLERIRGGVNLARHAIMDKGLNAVMGQRWQTYKQQQAWSNAEVEMRRRQGS
jgi:hypothetical protein